MSDLAYIEHKKKVHCLPVWNVDAEKDKKSGIFGIEQAFSGVLESYCVPVGYHFKSTLKFGW